MNDLVVAGCGYCARHFIRTHRGEALRAVSVRSTHKAAELTNEGLPAVIFGPDEVDPALATALAQAESLLVSIPPDPLATGPSSIADPVLAHYRALLARAPRLKNIVYLSTIGVYAPRGDLWIDENTPPDPRSPRARARVQAEREWQALAAEHGGLSLHILRLAGIYGPGRNVLERLIKGTARHIVQPAPEPAQLFNRIHVEDVALTIRAALDWEGKGTHIWNVCDEEPATPTAVLAHAAALTGLPMPPPQSMDEARLSPMARSFYDGTKKISNRRLKEELGVTLAFPTFREGLAAIGLSKQ